jgi:predicted DCC family thiol-disulfide oxidoreductase YuxK
MAQQIVQQAGSELVVTRPVVVYDGECPFCRKQVARIQRRDVRDQFEYLPRQAASLIDRFPILAEADFNTGMRLVLPDGHVHVGADAVYHIARRLPGWRWIVWLYRVPILHALARRIYRWIASNRQRLAQDCDDGACRMESTDHSAIRRS